jgi:transcriptional regulator with XRE-family HTH domain
MASPQDAPVYRRRLRSELRRARAEAGLTQRDVAEAMDWSLSKLNRIESGSVGISTNDLKVLLQQYGIVDAAEVDRFLSLARASREQRGGWWTDYREVASQQYLTFLGYENSASVIQGFQPLLLPGLLQTEDYARAVLHVLRPASDKRVDELVQLRLRRQQELRKRKDRLELSFVIDEAALHRWIGGRDVMRQQLLHLKDEAARDNVTIEVVQFTAGAHPGMQGPFVLMEFSDEREDDVVFVENPRGDVILREEQEAIEPYREAFADLLDLARQADLGTVVDLLLKQMG